MALHFSLHCMLYFLPVCEMGLNQAYWQAAHRVRWSCSLTASIEQLRVQRNREVASQEDLKLGAVCGCAQARHHCSSQLMAKVETGKVVNMMTMLVLKSRTRELVFLKLSVVVRGDKKLDSIP